MWVVRPIWRSECWRCRCASALAAQVHKPSHGAPWISVSEPSPRPGRRKPITARWLAVPDGHDRLLLELYAAQTLGLSVSHPKVRAELTAA